MTAPTISAVYTCQPANISHNESPTSSSADFYHSYEHRRNIKNQVLETVLSTTADFHVNSTKY